ncbi:MAG: ATP-binding cassette domain-containing protein [Meiothermus sp.]|uniref:ABC transporter ATP-binding protein n=1 Tax=Meiothermus sp. TaxID=1955249 RepID=UPI0025DB7367|nr:ATP-binding cassette domain-containing protein [Meiothermus sp.]MCS7057501.1 ATP-binding cassette domain-containing protein [Meiothermus sp.]MDW8090854.1 ATP-binding cassette domain-containing protein [Meiothermus sp.]MDW8482450.1 ATP-binding cassette domain-containing protein [Meiothermus sp.]
MVEAEGLRKTYRGFQAVRGLSFRVEPGQVYGLLGPNGAGKTTTLRMLATLLKPTAGRARLAGFDVERQPLEVRRNLGIVNGGMRVYDRLTGYEVLDFFGSFYDLWGSRLKERIAWVAELLRIERAVLGKQVREMSSGMQQKIVIARAILHQPQVLLLDEATAGLDVFARRALLDFVQQYASLGKTLVYSTHVMSEAEEVCDRVGFIDRGLLVYEGSLKEALELGSGSLERAFIRRLEEVAA